MRIESIEDGLLVDTGAVSFTYQTEDVVRDRHRHSKPTDNTLDWTNNRNHIGDFVIHPFGSNNDLPTVIKDTVQRNYMGQGQLRKKAFLLWGMGPRPYTEVLEDNRWVRKWVDNADVMKWLDDIGYEEYLAQTVESYQYIQASFTKVELNRGGRIGRPAQVKRLTNIPAHKARLATSFSAEQSQPTHVVVNDFSFDSPKSLSNWKAYRLFDPANPFKHENSVIFSGLATFGSDYYPVPEIYGSLEWLNRSTTIPLIFKAMAKKSMNLKYHITSPQSFWDSKRTLIQEQCAKANREYKEQMLIDYQREFLKKMGDVLSSSENVGKYLHTVDTLFVEGVNVIQIGWKVNVIQENVKDYVEAMINISKRADYAVSAGIGLNESLGNLSESSKPSSGSGRYYALMEYLNTSVDIPEMVVCRPINLALKANFPKLGIKIGFYHNVVEKQEDISPDDRMKNNLNP